MFILTLANLGVAKVPAESECRQMGERVMCPVTPVWGQGIKTYCKSVHTRDRAYQKAEE